MQLLNDEASGIYNNHCALKGQRSKGGSTGIKVAHNFKSVH